MPDWEVVEARGGVKNGKKTKRIGDCVSPDSVGCVGTNSPHQRSVHGRSGSKRWRVLVYQGMQGNA